MSELRFTRASIGVVIACGVAVGQTTTRVSMSSLGMEGNGNSGGIASISGDGRYLAFSSVASNLVNYDTNGWQDVFLRDPGGRVTLVSVDSSGVQGNYISAGPSISGDGRFVAFQSLSTNLVAGDTNGAYDVFVRDRQSGTTVSVSVDSSGAPGNWDSWLPSISVDGRFIAFISRATNLVANDTNGVFDAFVYDRQNSTTERVSVATGGAQGDGKCSGITAISADGRFVSFWSFATNLVAADTNGLGDIFVRDRASGMTERVSVTSAGVEGNSQCGYPSSISADGRFVAFESYATDLVAGDTNHQPDVFVRDRQLATTERVSVGAGGSQANAFSGQPSISTDGRFVVFWSFASNLVAGDTNATYDVFLRDRQLGTTERVSVDTGGAQADAGSSTASISPDGRLVVFESAATNLVSGDTNGCADLFVRDRRPPPTAYCTSGTSSNGCSASIAAIANPSVSQANACDITVANVDGQRFGILFYGVDNTGHTPGPWGSGSTSYLCVKAPTQRTPIQVSGGTFGACDGSFALDWNAYQASHPLALGNPWSLGAKVFVQAWFRDPLAVKATNLSNALEMTYVP